MIRNNRGFSLVEGLVSAVLASVVAGIAITLVIVNSAEIREGAANTTSQMESETVSAQIGEKVREAYAVIQPGEAVGGIFTFPADSTAEEVNLVDESGAVLGGYKINKGTSPYTLQEYDVTTGLWENFKAGASVVQVTDHAGEVSRFILPGARKGLSMEFVFYENDGVKTYWHSGRSDTYRCRN